MPRQRVQINTDALPAGTVRPAARVRPDTYQPVNPAQTQAAQLARGLAEVQPSLLRFADVASDRFIKGEEAKAKRDAIEAMRQNQQELFNAIRSGKFPAHASPWYRATLANEAGAIAASRWHSDFVAQSMSALKDATDMAAFDQFAQEHFGQWVETNLGGKISNKNFETGFSAGQEAYLEQERLNWSRQIGARVAQQADEQLSAYVYDRVGYALDQGTTSEEIGQWATQLLDERYRLNPLAVAGNRRMLASAIVNVARRRNDSSILDILDHVQDGPATNGVRPALSAFDTVAQLREEAENAIASDNAARFSRESQRVDRERYESKLELMGQLTTALEASDPDISSVDLKPFVDQMRAVDPSAVGMVYDVANAYTNRVLQDDPLALQGAWVRVHMYPEGDPRRLDKEDATLLLSQRRITTDTYRQLVAAIESRDAGTDKTLIDDDWFQLGRQRLRGFFVNEFGFETGSNRVRSDHAQAEFITQYVAFRRDNPEATDQQINAWMTQTVQNLARVWSGAGEGGTQDVVVRLEDTAEPVLTEGAFDWKTTPITDPDKWARLRPQFVGYLQGRAMLSNEALAFVLRSGVQPEKIREFVTTQDALMRAWQIRLNNHTSTPTPP